ncbi:histidine triad nucleotide-binding protein [Archangium sp.]|uniref:histidine triad nucleotide-binding protein n=1 Tax=Archangium sp. TaxID=1872627 RepID=UPI002D593627|nr:histidine triad nucleotide-binding protein [Archangium sp.]HYO54760.1 histidine triad nucleotide-binding protein [Archangium sp.]
MSNCIFCKIRDGHVPSRIVHRDDLCLAIEDINPQAPTHLLVIPLEHVSTVNDLTVDHRELVGHLHLTAAKLARQRGIADSGYRLVFNTHRDAGQTVFHIHLHVLGGRPMGWPPG